MAYTARVRRAFAVIHHRAEVARKSIGEGVREGFVYVRVDEDGLVGAPDHAAEEEGCEEGDTVVELEGGAGQVELVAEPVDV